MKHYNAQEIEKKWQEYWEKHKTYRTEDRVEGKENFYALSEFAYPSGNLHVGHWYAFAVPDIYARFKRMNGYNVLYPMGFDAFGLPAENAAIKRGLDPKKWTYENMDYMRTQLKSMGASFDWERSLATSDPEYYKWTQWMFGEFYKNDLVKRINTKANWCDSCKTVLANEQVVAGKCERCDSDVVQKDMAQWAFKITDFADELIDDLDTLDWDESIKQAQREWIGRKEGSEISFPVSIKNKKKEAIKILIATNNKSKKARVQKLLEKNNISIDLVSSSDLGIESIDVDEDGTLEENAIAKAQAYHEQTDLPILANDTSLIIDGVELDPVRVKRNALGDSDEKDLSQEEIAQKILDFYIDIIKEKGGKVNGYWYEKWALVMPDGTTHINEAKRNIVLTDEIHGEVDLYFPLRSLYYSQDTGKYHHEATEEDYLLEMQPVVSALTYLLSFVKRGDKEIKVFTTRADTLFGVTYVVLAPEHQLVKELKNDIHNWDEVEAYLKEVEKKSELDRQQDKSKTGVQLKGVYAINPANGEEVPVWIADYVLPHFGTGAVMAVPAHDERDAEFAIKYDLPFKFVVLPSAGEMGNSRPLVTYGENAFIKSASETLKTMKVDATAQEIINAEWNAMYDLLGELDGKPLPKGKRFCCTFEGKLINSTERFGAITSEEAKKRITEFVGGEMKKTYRLRDWGISRQRYWGTPIPVVYNKEEKDFVEKNAHNIHFYNEETWDRLKNGFKTIETRALNPEEKERYFGNIGEGDFLRAINKNTQEELIFLVKKVWTFKNLEELLQYPDIIKKIYAPKKPAQTIDELVKGYSFTNDYVEKINTNGLIAWKVEKIIPGVRLVPEEHLPWLLPEDVDHTPDGTAPLARSEELKKRTEEIFGEGWIPEVDTMDTFVDSTWYFYRYLDNKNEKAFASQEALKHWMPVDMYFGGAEHTTMHLLYSRFWTKALYKLGYVNEKEPYRGRLNRGLILGPDGAKMSKSKGNVIDPDKVVAQVGADTVRMYLAFIGPFNEPGNYPWDPNGVVGVRRFIERVYGVSDKLGEKSSEDIIKLIHKTIKKVTEDVDRLKLNTAISALMVLVNAMEKQEVGRDEYAMLIKMFSIFAPHMGEEIWQEVLGNTESVHQAEWPQYDESLMQDDTLTLPVQVNGKVRAQLNISVDANEEEVREQVLALPEIQKWIDGKDIKKFIFVKGKIVNVVI